MWLPHHNHCHPIPFIPPNMVLDPLRRNNMLSITTVIARMLIGVVGTAARAAAVGATVVFTSRALRKKKERDNSS